MEPQTEVEAAPTPIMERVSVGQKSMQVSMDNPVHAFQTIVGRAKPDYIVTLHKLLGTFAECASQLKH